MIKRLVLNLLAIYSFCYNSFAEKNVFFAAKECLAPKSNLPALNIIFDTSYFKENLDQLSQKKDFHSIHDIEVIILNELYQRIFDVLRHPDSQGNSDVNIRLKKFIQWWKEPQVRKNLTKYLDVRISMLEKVLFGNDILEAQAKTLVKMETDLKLEADQLIESQAKQLVKMQGDEMMTTTVMSSGFSISELNKSENGGYPFADFIRDSQGDFLKKILGEDPTVMLVNNKWVVIGMDTKWSDKQSWLGNRSLLDMLYVDGWSAVKKHLDTNWTEINNKNDSSKDAIDELKSFIKSNLPKNFHSDNTLNALVQMITETVDSREIAKKDVDEMLYYLENEAYNSLVNRLKNNIGLTVSSLRSAPASAVESMQWLYNGLDYLEKSGNEAVRFSLASREYNNLYAKLNKYIRWGGRNDLKDTKLMNRFNNLYPLIQQDDELINMVINNEKPEVSFEKYNSSLSMLGKDAQAHFKLSMDEWKLVLPLIMKRQARHQYNNALNEEISSNSDKIIDIDVTITKAGLDKDISEEELLNKYDSDKVDFNMTEIINAVRRKSYIHEVNMNLQSMIYEDEVLKDGSVSNKDWRDLMGTKENRFDLFLTQAAYRKSVEVVNFLFDKFEGSSAGKEYFYFDMKGMGFIPLMPYTNDYFYQPEKNRQTLKALSQRENLDKFYEHLDQYSSESIWNRRDKKFIEKWAFPVVASIHTNFSRTNLLKERFFKPYGAQTAQEIKLQNNVIAATIDGDEHRLAFRDKSGKVFNLSFDFDNFQAGDRYLRRLNILGDRDALFFEMHEGILKAIDKYLALEKNPITGEEKFKGTVGDLQSLGDYILQQVPNNVKVDLNPDLRNDKQFLKGIKEYLRELNSVLDNQPKEESYLLDKKLLKQISRELDKTLKNPERPFQANIPLRLFYFKGLAKRSKGDKSRLQTGNYSKIGITGAGSVLDEEGNNDKDLSPDDFVREYEKNDDLTENMKFFGKKGSFLTEMTEQQSIQMKQTIKLNSARTEYYLSMKDKLRADNSSLKSFSDFQLDEALEILLLSEISSFLPAEQLTGALSPKATFKYLDNIRSSSKSLLSVLGGKDAVSNMAMEFETNFHLDYMEKQKQIERRSSRINSTAA